MQRLDELLLEDLTDSGAHRTGDEASRHDRKRNRRQDEMADLVPNWHGLRVLAHPGRWQDSEIYRKDHHEHHAKPILRHRYAGDGDRADRAIGEPAVAIGSEGAEHDAANAGQQDCSARELEGVQHRWHDLGYAPGAGL